MLLCYKLSSNNKEASVGTEAENREELPYIIQDQQPRGSNTQSVINSPLSIKLESNSPSHPLLPI